MPFVSAAPVSGVFFFRPSFWALISWVVVFLDGGVYRLPYALMVCPYSASRARRFLFSALTVYISNMAR